MVEQTDFSKFLIFDRMPVVLIMDAAIALSLECRKTEMPRAKLFRSSDIFAVVRIIMIIICAFLNN